MKQTSSWKKKEVQKAEDRISELKEQLLSRSGPFSEPFEADFEAPNG